MTAENRNDDYNMTSRLVYITDEQNVLASFDYTLREDGMRIAVTETDHEANVTTIAWDYDNLGRLIEEVYDSHDPALDYTATYTFDLVGNRLEKTLDQGSDGAVEETITYVYDDNDQLLTETMVSTTETDTTTTYEYGGPTNPGVERTTKVVEETSGGAVVEDTQYEYNLQGRLAKVEIDADGDGQTDTEVEYTYDDTGIRVRRTKDGQSTLYLIDKNNPTGFAQVLEEIANDNIVRSYTIGLRILAQHDESSVARYLLADGHGSTRLLVDALGAPISGQLFRYDAYGNPIGFDPAAALTAHLYAGEWRDAAIGLDYLRDRWLDPAAGRFTRMDRFEGVLANPLTLHKLLHVHGNPIMGVDPTGQFAMFADISISSAIRAGLKTLSTSRLAPVIRMLSPTFLYPLLGATAKMTALAAGIRAVIGAANQAYVTSLIAHYMPPLWDQLTVLSAELRHSPDRQLQLLAHPVDSFAFMVFQTTQQNPIWTTAQFQFWAQMGLAFTLGHGSYRANTLYSVTAQIENVAEQVLRTVGFHVTVDIHTTYSASRFLAFQADPAGDVASIAQVVRAYNSGNMTATEQAGHALAMRLAEAYGRAEVHGTPVGPLSPPVVYE